jgi:hypothetical protein
VRTIPDKHGRPRLWYDDGEIEQIAVDAIRDAGLWPDPNIKAIDVDALVEMHLRATVDYGVQLDRNVLGYTIFEQPTHVVVSRALTEMALAPAASLGLRGRWRATLAHEAAHILLHGHLYARGESSRKQMAIRGDLAEDADPAVDVRDWKEQQANMGMASILMPRQLFLSEARRILDEGGPVFPPFARESDVAARLTDQLAETFQTSQQATRFRLMEFGFIEKPDDPEGINGRLRARLPMGHPHAR